MSTISREQLQAMGVRELRQQAQNVGVLPQAIDEARDSAEPKEQLINLIIVAVDALGAMGMRELRAKATELGVSAGAIDKARDGANPKVRRCALLRRLPLRSRLFPRRFVLTVRGTTAGRPHRSHYRTKECPGSGHLARSYRGASACAGACTSTSASAGASPNADACLFTRTCSYSPRCSSASVRNATARPWRRRRSTGGWSRRRSPTGG